MTADLVKLSESILRETEDFRFDQEIEDKSSEIAQRLKETGVYYNPESGLKISIPNRER